MSCVDFRNNMHQLGGSLVYRRVAESTELNTKQWSQLHVNDKTKISTKFKKVTVRMAGWKES